MTDREKYWRAVAANLRQHGVSKLNGRQLDWATLECLAESSGYARHNIPNPANMAQNGVMPKFGPRGD